MSEKPRYIKQITCIKDYPPFNWEVGCSYSLFEVSEPKFKYMVVSNVDTYIPDFSTISEFFKR